MNNILCDTKRESKRFQLAGEICLSGKAKLCITSGLNKSQFLTYQLIFLRFFAVENRKVQIIVPHSTHEIEANFHRCYQNCVRETIEKSKY